MPTITKIFIDKGKYSEMKHDYLVNFLTSCIYYSFWKYSLNTLYVSDTEDIPVNNIKWTLFFLF